MANEGLIAFFHTANPGRRGWAYCCSVGQQDHSAPASRQFTRPRIHRGPILHGFTLIELLVVVTIIVVLLALLVPVMDKAIYQAELAACGANLHAIGFGALNYAVESKRAYPYRRALHERTHNWQPMALQWNRDLNGFDDRVVLKGYVNLNGHLNCPLNPVVDIENSQDDTRILSSYSLWLGWGFNDGRARPGMFRVGDRFGWEVGERFSVLASDLDSIVPKQNAVVGAHPDRAGVMAPQVYQDQYTLVAYDKLTASFWASFSSSQRGAIDINAVFDDGSVGRNTGVENAGDERIARVPAYENGQDWDGGSGWWMNIPRR